MTTGAGGYGEGSTTPGSVSYGLLGYGSGGTKGGVTEARPGGKHGEWLLRAHGMTALPNIRMQQTAPLGGRAGHGGLVAAASCSPFGEHRRRS